MSEAMKRAYEHSEKWLKGLKTARVNAVASEAQLRLAFAGPLPQTGCAAPEVVDYIADNAKDGLLGSAGGRFFAWVIGGGVPSALAADWLVSTWDQNAAVYASSPASAVIEEVAGEWIKELLDLPKGASFAFTTGCQMAHMTALASARHAVLAKYGWSIEDDGLWGAPQIKIFTSGNRHGSVERAARYLGLGRKCFHPVATDELGRMLPEALEREMADYDGPAIVALNAADLNVGACDPFAELIPIAKQKDAWVHCDGAFGLFARASRKKKHLVAGIELADSWVTDGHKWLNVPFDCGIAIVNDPKAHRAAMTLAVDYVASSQSARDQMDWNPEWSRRARGVPVYAALKEMGRNGVEDMIDRCCTFCLEIVQGIGAIDGAEIVSVPTLNQGMVRFTRNGNSDEQNDTYTLEIMEAINASGEAFFSDTIWHGRRAMRVSVVNWRTTKKDVQKTIAIITKVLTA